MLITCVPVEDVDNVLTFGGGEGAVGSRYFSELAEVPEANWYTPGSWYRPSEGKYGTAGGAVGVSLSDR